MGASSHSEIAGEIVRDIRDGRYAVGERFPSLTQIMRRFGVSRMTALRAVEDLKGKGLVASRPGCGTFVSPQARMLGGSFGFVVPGFAYAEIFPPICRKLSRLAQARGFHFLFGDISADEPGARAEQALALARSFAAEGVLGVFFQPVELVRNAERFNREILAVFDAAQIPVMLIDSDIVPSPARSAYDLVGVNNFDAGRRLALHLVERGARRVGFLRSPYSDFSVTNRCQGVRSVVTARRLAELTVDPADVSAVRRALSRRPGLDAIVCRSDRQAAVLLATLRKLGKRVPKDVMVAGFNDVEYAAVLEPSLTTVRLPCEDVAQVAFDMMLSRMGAPALPPRECYLPAPLVVRESTGSAVAGLRSAGRESGKDRT